MIAIDLMNTLAIMKLKDLSLLGEGNRGREGGDAKGRREEKGDSNGHYTIHNTYIFLVNMVHTNKMLLILHAVSV